MVFEYMSLSALSHVTDWIFDLDNTLYPRECNLFAQVDVAITRYVAQHTSLPVDEARALQKRYYHDHGTTLNGLMLHHKVDPDHYLAAVHNIDYSPVMPNPALIEAIRALPGRKFIFTNADTGHARSVLARLGENADELFDGIFDIRDAGYQPKPLKIAYDACFEAFGVDPRNAAMFEDLQKNLVVPHEMGMVTVHVTAGEGFVHEQVDAWELEGAEGLPHIHHVTDDLVKFLTPEVNPVRLSV